MNLAVTEAGTNEAGKRRLSFGGNFNCLLFANLGPVSRASQHCWNCFFFFPSCCNQSCCNNWDSSLRLRGYACPGYGCSVGTRDWFLICQICFYYWCRSIDLVGARLASLRPLRHWELIRSLFTMSSRNNGGSTGEGDATKVPIWNPPVGTQPIKPRPPPPPRQK